MKTFRLVCYAALVTTSGVIAGSALLTQSQDPDQTPPIPANTYEGQGEAVSTFAVGAQWLVSADQSDELVYGITKALWNKTTKKLLRHHAKGKDVTLETALGGRGIPLHPGAERYYRETGLLK